MANTYAKQSGSILGGGGGGGGGVTSLNTEIGDVILVAGSGISVTPAGQNITIAATGGTGTVTSVSVATANGFAGSVASPTTTPAITLSVPASGIIKSNGTAIGAATAGTDYSAGTSALTTGILKSTTTTGALTIAVAGTDYQAAGNYITALTGDLTASGPGSVASTLATVNSNVGSFTNASLTVNAKGLITAASSGTAPVTAVSVASANGFAGSSSGGATPALTLSTSITGVLKGNATAISAATAGTDYSAGTSALATGILKSTTTTGALSIAASGTDYAPATSGTSYLIGNGSGGFTNATSTGSGNNVLATSPTITTPTIAALANLTTNGYVKTGSGTGTLSVQTTPLPVADVTISTQAISAAAIDWSTGNVFTKTLAANTTFTFSNQTSGQTLIVRLTNTASNWTVTWPTVKWSGGTAPTMTIGAFSDVYTFIYDGSSTYGSYVQNMS